MKVSVFQWPNGTNASHEADIDKMIGKVRNWLQGYTTATPFPGGAAICDKHTKFRTALPSICTGAALEPAKLTFQDLTHTIDIYLTTPPARTPKTKRP